MNRVIKFRAFSKNSGMWSWEKLKGNNPEPHPLSCLYSHEGWQVMQFTGLLDKNGKEIYEGDIISYPSGMVTSDPNGTLEYKSHPGMKFSHAPNKTAEVVFESCSFCVKNGSPLLSANLKSEEIEVIGNSYENPELIR